MSRLNWPFEIFHEPFEQLGDPFRIYHELFGILNNPFEWPMESVCNSFGSRSFYPLNGKSLVNIML